MQIQKQELKQERTVPVEHADLVDLAEPVAELKAEIEKSHKYSNNNNKNYTRTTSKVPYHDRSHPKGALHQFLLSYWYFSYY